MRQTNASDPEKYLDDLTVPRSWLLDALDRKEDHRAIYYLATQLVHALGVHLANLVHVNHVMDRVPLDRLLAASRV